MGELVAALTTVKDALSIISPPEITGHKDMSLGHVSKAIGGAKMTWLDQIYIAVPQKEFQKIIDWDWTDNKKYIAEKYDCDNFAFSFKARVDRRFHVNRVGLVIILLYLPMAPLKYLSLNLIVGLRWAVRCLNLIVRQYK